MQLVAASSTGEVEASPRKVAGRMGRKIEGSTIINCRHRLIYPGHYHYHDSCRSYGWRVERILENWLGMPHDYSIPSHS